MGGMTTSVLADLGALGGFGVVRVIVMVVVRTVVVVVV